MTDEDWDALDKQYTEQVGTAPATKTQYAKKGAKLKNLKMAAKEKASDKGSKKPTSKVEEYKKGGKKKKCECGCEVVAKKFKGGQLVDTCGCCGKVHDQVIPEAFKAGGKMSDKNSKLNSKKSGAVAKSQAGGEAVSAKSQMGVAKKGAKVKPMDRVKTGQKGLKTAQRDSVTAYNRINSTESESGKGPQSSKEVLEAARKGNFGPGNTKKDYIKSLKETKAVNKNEKGGKAPAPSKNLPLNKASLKKEEKRNAEISIPDRIGKAKMGKKLKSKKC